MSEQLNKFLTFKLGEESYAIPILEAKEIIGIIDITPVPRMPAYIKGVINLRGRIIPVIDLRLKFDMVEKDYNDRTPILIVELPTDHETKLCGIILDNVKEVLNIENIDPPPKHIDNSNIKYINGIGKYNENIYMILDLYKLLDVTENESE
jgi:purine-binding chemotaxis protein CheW